MYNCCMVIPDKTFSRYDSLSVNFSFPFSTDYILQEDECFVHKMNISMFLKGVIDHWSRVGFSKKIFSRNEMILELKPRSTSANIYGLLSCSCECFSCVKICLSPIQYKSRSSSIPPTVLSVFFQKFCFNKYYIFLLVVVIVISCVGGVYYKHYVDPLLTIHNQRSLNRANK